MPDVTHRMKADRYLAHAEEFESENGSFATASMARAAVHATLALGQALREIDAKLKWTTDQLVGAIHSQRPIESRWLYWRDADDNIVSLNLARVVLLTAVSANLTNVTTVDGLTVSVPLSYGEVSLQAGN